MAPPVKPEDDTMSHRAGWEGIWLMFSFPALFPIEGSGERPGPVEASGLIIPLPPQGQTSVSARTERRAHTRVRPYTMTH